MNRDLEGNIILPRWLERCLLWLKYQFAVQISGLAERVSERYDVETLRDQLYGRQNPPKWSSGIIYVDSVFGNDLTGEINNPSKPFQNWTEAYRAASPHAAIMLRQNKECSHDIG